MCNCLRELFGDCDWLLVLLILFLVWMLAENQG